MIKLLKKKKSISPITVCLSLGVRHGWLGTQSKEADAARGLTTSCLGNYHHFWHELRGLLTASLLLLNSLLRWLMMKREHAPTPLPGLWHNVCASPVAQPAGQAKHNTHRRDCMDYHRGMAINTLFISIWWDTLLGKHTHTHRHTHLFKFNHFIISVAGLRSHISP